MHAVLIEVDVSGVDRDQGLTALREQIVPAIKAMPGFTSGTWLPGNDEGKGLSLTVWDSDGDARGMAGCFGPAATTPVGVVCRNTLLDDGAAHRTPRRRRARVRRRESVRHSATSARQAARGTAEPLRPPRLS